MTVVSFLQSGAWEKFQQSIGRKTWRADGRLLIRHDLPAGLNYLYSPRPASVTDEWLSDVRKIAEKEGAVFLKIDPIDKFSTPMLPEIGAPTASGGVFSSDTPRDRSSDRERRSFQFSISGSVQPQKTLIIDIEKSEEDLFADMHPKTRYNIRLAERHGVRISGSTDKAKFWDILQETSGRDKFHVHGREHYEKLLEAREHEFSNELFLAEYGGKMIAAAIVNFYLPSKTATYLHGASAGEHRAVMAPYLLHWRILQEVKKRGLKYYDLWGIDEKRWPGFTRFKLGFGGRRVEYPDSVDILYRPVLYKAYKLIKKLRS